MSDEPSLYRRIYDVVRSIPPGRVMSYGQVGEIVGCQARVVGYALHHLRHLTNHDVPWQRVVNRHGSISTSGTLQRDMLEHEGVRFDTHGNVFKDVFWWYSDATGDEQ